MRRQDGRFVVAAHSFSALQRAEIAEIERFVAFIIVVRPRFSALQRAEIAEIRTLISDLLQTTKVSVLFNEPKLLKSGALLRAPGAPQGAFQCSSTSRNC